MEKVERYRKILRDVLTAYAAPRSIYPEPIETQLLFDPQHDRYQVLRVGWRNRAQVFLVIFHFEIRDGKIWLHQNATDYDIIEDIEAQGVPKSDIVLAFHAPELRPYTDYAVA